MEDTNKKPTNREEDLRKYSIYEHLIELKKRLIYSLIFFVICFIICYFFKEQLFLILTKPLAKIYQDFGVDGKMIYTSLTEAFITYIKLSLYSATLFSAPFIIIQFYLFLSPALYKEERAFMIKLFIAIPFFFILGSLFAYYVMFPIAWEFFFAFQTGIENVSANNLSIKLEPKINEYLSLVISIIFAFGITFELPILLFFLLKTGIISIDFLKRNRKYAIVIIFIVAAILTPPDVISQILLAIPLLLLYELSIFLFRSTSSITK